MLPQIRRGYEEPQPPRHALPRSRSALACGVPLFRAPRAAAILFRSGALRPALAARRPAPRGLSLGAYVPSSTMSRLKGVSHEKAIVSVSGRRCKVVHRRAGRIRRASHRDMLRCVSSRHRRQGQEQNRSTFQARHQRGRALQGCGKQRRATCPHHR